jgi:hypothetical protein
VKKEVGERACENKKAAVVLLFWAIFYLERFKWRQLGFWATEEETGDAERHNWGLRGYPTITTRARGEGRDIVCHRNWNSAALTGQVRRTKKKKGKRAGLAN